jgi:hypothetical protein
MATTTASNRTITAEADEPSRCDCGARGQQPVTSINWYNRAPTSDLHVVVRMNLAVTYFLAHALEQWFDVCVEVPLVDPGKGRKRQGFQTLGYAQVVPPANVLLMGIVGPRIVRDANDSLLDIDEACRLQVLAGPVLIGNGSRNAPCGVSQPLVPLHKLALGIEGAVIAAWLHVDFDVLQVAAAGSEVSGGC